MGGIDKPLLKLHGRPMLAWVIEALAVADIAISANGDSARFAPFGRPVIDDGAFKGHGPLAGVLAGLEWAATMGADVLLTAPADTPFLPKGLAGLLMPAPSAVEASGRQHHLVALWPVACASELRNFLLASGPRSVALFASRIGMRYRVVAFDGPDPFANVNTMADLEHARRLAAALTEGRPTGPKLGTR